MIENLQQLLTPVLADLSKNEFFQGGAVLGALGLALNWGRAIPAKIFTLLKRRVVCELDVQEGSYAFASLVHWMAVHPYTHRSRRLTARAERRSEEDAAMVQVSPAPGLHLIWHKSRPILISRGRERQGGAEGILMGFYESFTLQTVMGRDVLVALVAEAVERFRAVEKGGPAIYASNGYGGYDMVGSLNGRPLESVVLPRGVLECLVDDFSQFMGAADWYASVGVPYRRGYLLHGPPGTGKSSTCVALATHFGVDLACASLGGGDLDDGKLAKFFQNLPRRCLILLEDVDCLYQEDRTAKNDAGKVTLSGLLNAIDGAVAQEGRVLCMTTNHRDRLDPALIRPGRVDVEMGLGPMDLDQLERMFLRFFPDEAARAWVFAQAVGGGTVTPAEAQKWLMLNRNDIDAAANWS